MTCNEQCPCRSRVGDEADRLLWEYVVRYSVGGQPLAAAQRMLHLARAYRAGVGIDEILARIDAGELEVR